MDSEGEILAANESEPEAEAEAEIEDITVISGLEGEGTFGSPFLIQSPKDFKLFMEDSQYWEMCSR
jgi:hypothetical protein